MERTPTKKIRAQTEESLPVSPHALECLYTTTTKALEKLKEDVKGMMGRLVKDMDRDYVNKILLNPTPLSHWPPFLKCSRRCPHQRPLLLQTELLSRFLPLSRVPCREGQPKISHQLPRQLLQLVLVVVVVYMDELDQQEKRWLVLVGPTGKKGGWKKKVDVYGTHSFF